jgi:Spy/CpxP family protein refolding chaperone
MLLRKVVTQSAVIDCLTTMHNHLNARRHNAPALRSRRSALLTTLLALPLIVGSGVAAEARTWSGSGSTEQARAGQVERGQAQQAQRGQRDRSAQAQSPNPQNRQGQGAQEGRGRQRPGNPNAQSPNGQGPNAQGNRGRQERPDLNLTSEQEAQLRALQEETRSQMDAVLTPEQRAMLETAREQRQRPRLNLTTEQREQMQAIREASQAAHDAILTPEQRQQIEDHRQNRPGRGNPGDRPGPGMGRPGGPGPDMEGLPEAPPQ